MNVCVLYMFSSYYLDHNIWVNIYTVDSKWLYSLYWCMNVSSITTNMCNEFAQMSSPAWHMVRQLYMQVWPTTPGVDQQKRGELLKCGIYYWQFMQCPRTHCHLHRPR